jgi:uncharacterized membrane protein YbhN (UPF0104 family)
MTLSTPQITLKQVSLKYRLWAWLRRHWSLPLAGLILGLALLALRHLLADLDLPLVANQLANYAWPSLLAMLALSALSYVTMIGYDLAALHYIKAKVPLGLTALASFAGYTAGNNIGFAVLSGGAVRYRLYRRAGLSAKDIARIVVFCTMTFGTGVCFVGAFGLLLDTGSIAEMAKMPISAVYSIAYGAMALLVAILYAAWRSGGQIKLWRWHMRVPGAKLLLLTVAIASLELCLTAGILYAALPGAVGLDFLGFVGLYSAAIIISLMTHVPGGVGVFEAIMIACLKSHIEVESIVAALIVFRAVYFLIPFGCASLMFGLYELWHALIRFRVLRRNSDPA